jgi:hypothetical protein
LNGNAFGFSLFEVHRIDCRGQAPADFNGIQQLVNRNDIAVHWVIIVGIYLLKERPVKALVRCAGRPAVLQIIAEANAFLRHIEADVIQRRITSYEAYAFEAVVFKAPPGTNTVSGLLTLPTLIHALTS